MSENKEFSLIKTFSQSFLAAGVSSAVVAVVLAPVQRVKLILQLQAVSRQVSPQNSYKGMIDTLVRVTREESFFSLWRGTSTNLPRSVVGATFNFGFKDFYEERFSGQLDRDRDFWTYFGANLAAGGLAGLTVTTFMHPLDFATTRLATNFGSEKGKFFEQVKFVCKTVRSDGVLILYKGFLSSITGVFVYRSVYFGFYDTSKGAFRSKTLINTMIAAQTSSVLAMLLAYPFDTVRRRLMMQVGLPKRQVVYKSTLDCWVKIAKQEGPLAFYKGAFTNIALSTGGAAMLVFYDIIKMKL
ncbi:unnamed protein product [Phyllotreta striolata]|uniref:ADP/ATP translocase n=1 Tax=Phyllotreta striolata TaxID=444603 RepID=A0A9N9TGX6_PHYSR|nr:unnamed protein product [Phyllotreta striolata]